MVANQAAVGPVSLALGQAVTSFSIFLPSFTAVRQAKPDNEGIKKDVRLGEMAAFAMAVGIGVILSQVSGEPAPAMVAVFIAVMIIALYEQALRSC